VDYNNENLQSTCKLTDGSGGSLGERLTSFDSYKMPFSSFSSLTPGADNVEEEAAPGRRRVEPATWYSTSIVRQANQRYRRHIVEPHWASADSLTITAELPGVEAEAIPAAGVGEVYNPGIQDMQHIMEPHRPSADNLDITAEHSGLEAEVIPAAGNPGKTGIAVKARPVNLTVGGRGRPVLLPGQCGTWQLGAGEDR
jgi:hypothetical protein